MKNNYKRLINKNLGLTKKLRKKVINNMLNGKVMIIYLIAGLIAKTLYKISQYFPEPFGRDI